MTNASQSPEPSSLQLQLEPASAAHSLYVLRSSGPQSVNVSMVSGALPNVPQPKTSFEMPAVGAHPLVHCDESQSGSVRVPVAQKSHPSEDCRVVKKSGGSSARVAAAQPVGERVATSPAPVHTCHPSAQRSATLQPRPFGFGPSLPPWRLQAGDTVSKVGMPGHSGAIPGFWSITPGMLH